MAVPNQYGYLRDNTLERDGCTVGDSNITELNPEETVEQLKKENSILLRKINRLNREVEQEKVALTTLLNQQRVRTFVQLEMERFLSFLLANSPNIILFLDENGVVEFCTNYFVKKTGQKVADDIIGQRLSQFISPFMSSTFHIELLSKIGIAIQQHVTVSVEVTLDFVDSSADFEGLIVPMTDDDNNHSGLIIMFHDVTQLKKSREDALAASRAKSDFLSNMSHEIRTPMNAIMGMSAIGRKAQSIDDKDNAFEKIDSAATHLLGVINDVLDISKIESNKMELNPITFRFADLINKVSNVVSISMEGKQQNFVMKLDPNIPEYLYGDDHRLAQVLTNILANAHKFTPPNGEIKLAAQCLDATSEECAIQISITDTGIGISDEDKENLFDIFEQVDANTSRTYGGSGLGLAISKKLLDLMGGEITVESEKGKGSKFIITVHLWVVDSNQVEPKIESKFIAEKLDFSDYTILIVDDLDINLEIAEALIKPTKAKVVWALSGQEAIDIFSKEPERFDLIFMDVQMPGIDGLQTTEIIREMNHEHALAIPIVAMTANVFREDVLKCINSGMNGHLGKPLETNQLMSTLVKYLR